MSPVHPNSNVSVYASRMGGRSGITVPANGTTSPVLVSRSRRAMSLSVGGGSMGINPEVFRIVVAKGVSSPRPAYQPIAAEIIVVNSPGVTSADLDTFTFKNRRVPLYPFEEPDYRP